MTGALLFLLSLPLAVYTLAGIFQLVDQSNRFRALLHLALRVLLVAVLLAVAPVDDRRWIGAAFALVALLHIATSLFIRYAIRSERWQTERID